MSHINGGKVLFKSLLLHKEDIESVMGLALDWRELLKRKASRIIVEKEERFDERDQRPEQYDYVIDVCLKMNKAFKKYV